MIFCIITHVGHVRKGDGYYGYAPYIREMNIWLRHVNSVTIVAPLAVQELDEIHQAYSYDNIILKKVPEFDITTFKNILRALFLVPKILCVTYFAMAKADHIHLRCPGNMGLIGAIVQIFFPWKTKTAKYAGNWDPNAKQPWTYKLQKWILANTFLTKNMQVLVYGDWPKQSKNIKPFFTATYKASEQKPITPKNYDDILKFVFVGMLSRGKRPLYAVKLIEKLKCLGCNVQLEIYGEGTEKSILEDYIRDKSLCKNVFLKGNQNLETIKKAYQENHFVILPSKSEGWPKVIAEAMFWGCVPIATKVSCVPNMLDYGKRGIQLRLAIEEDCNAILELVNDRQTYNQMCVEGINWSRQFTIDHFEQEIAKLLKN